MQQTDHFPGFIDNLPASRTHLPILISEFNKFAVSIFIFIYKDMKKLFHLRTICLANLIISFIYIAFI